MLGTVKRVLRSCVAAAGLAAVSSVSFGQDCDLAVIGRASLLPGHDLRFVEVSGTTAVVASATSRLVATVDVTNPAAPTLMDSIFVTLDIDMEDIAFDGEFIAVVERSNQLSIIDARDPFNLSVARQVRIDFGFNTAVDMADGFLYMVQNSPGRSQFTSLLKFQISATGEPIPMGSSGAWEKSTALAIADDRAFIGMNFPFSDGTPRHEWMVWRASPLDFCYRAPFGPLRTGRSWPGGPGVWRDIAAFGDAAIMATVYEAMAVRAGPPDCEMAGAVRLADFPGAGGPFVQAVEIDADRFYVSEGGRGLRAFLRDGLLECASLPEAPQDMIIQGQYMFTVQEGVEDFVVMDLGATEAVWAGPESGDFDDTTRWRPEIVPMGDAAIRFPLEFPVGGTQEVPYSVFVPSDPETAVRSVTVEGSDVTLFLPGGLTPTTFRATDAVVLEGGSLQLRRSTIGGAAVGRLGTFALPEADGLVSSDSRLVVFDNIQVTAGASLELQPDERVVLAGTLTQETDESLPGLQGPVTLDAWGSEPPTPDAGEPQLDIQGHGHITGTLRNNGWLRLGPPDPDVPGMIEKEDRRLVVEGDFVQTETGVLEVVLDGTYGTRTTSTFGGAATTMKVSGTATIDGNLRITLADGYEPEPGDVFTIIQADGGIDLGAGLDSAGNPMDLTIRQRGFAEIEGVLLESGDADVFWGVDYNQRRPGEHVIEVVVLSVPTRVTATSEVPLTPDRIRAGTRDSMVLISHGTAGSIAFGGNPLNNGAVALGDIGRGMADVASMSGLANDYEIATLDWRQFSTRGIGVGSLVGCLKRTVAATTAGMEDSRGRLFDPYEAARFGQQYALSVLRFFEQAGYDVGSLDSFHTIGHSSGSYVADGFFDVLANSLVSPFEGSRPARTHLTLLDAYLPPVVGGRVIAGCLTWEGLSLAILGDSPPGASADTMDHYFNRDIASGTNNQPLLRVSPAAVDLDVTDFLRSRRTWSSGHSVPIEYYRDSIYVATGGTTILDPVRDALPGGSFDPDALLSDIGASFSPLFVDAGLGRSLSATLAGASAEELEDGDIDVVVSRPNTIELAVWGTGPVLVDRFVPTGIVTCSTPSACRYRTNSPAIGEYELLLDQEFNAVSFVLERVSGQGGEVEVQVDGEVIEIIDLAQELPFAGDSAEFGFNMPMAGRGELHVRIQLDDTGSGPVEVQFTELALAEIEYVVDTPCRADLDGDGALTIFDFLAFQNAFDAADPIADFDGDGAFTIFDFLAFQNEFDTGC